MSDNRHTLHGAGCEDHIPSQVIHMASLIEKAVSMGEMYIAEADGAWYLVGGLRALGVEAPEGTPEGQSYGAVLAKLVLNINEVEALRDNRIEPAIRREFLMQHIFGQKMKREGT